MVRGIDLMIGFEQLLGGGQWANLVVRLTNFHFHFSHGHSSLVQCFIVRTSATTRVARTMESF